MFEYSFIAQDPGTHFWHAHSSTQRADGIFGAIVIRDSNDINAKKYDFDLPEHVIVVNDWIHIPINSKYMSFLHSYGDEAISGVLINGKGVDSQYEGSLLGRETPRSQFKVSFGYRYRFRMINAGVQYCPLHVSIDNHNLTLIATDGVF